MFGFVLTSVFLDGISIMLGNVGFRREYFFWLLCVPLINVCRPDFVLGDDVPSETRAYIQTARAIKAEGGER